MKKQLSRPNGRAAFLYLPIDDYVSAKGFSLCKYGNNPVKKL